jgi:hypothetical protein
MPHFKSLPCVATNVIPQPVSNYIRLIHLVNIPDLTTIFSFIPNRLITSELYRIVFFSETNPVL